MNIASWFHRRQPSTVVELSLNASLQPVHRGDWYEDPLKRLLKDIAPGSRVIGGGSQLDERYEIVRSDIELSLTGDARAVLDEVLRVVLLNCHVPRGSYATIEGDRREFGTSAGIAVRMVPAPEIDVMYDEVPANEQFVEAFLRARDKLGEAGSAYSWMIRDHRASAYFAGESADDMSRIALAELGRSYPNAHLSVDVTA